MNEKSIIDFQEQDTGGEIELSAPEVFASNLVEWCLEQYASDLYLSNVEGGVMVSIRRLGQVHPVRKLAENYGHRLQSHFRVLAAADAGESLRPTEGRGRLTTPDGSVAHLRLNSVPTLFGQDVAIRLYDPIRGDRNLDDLGLDSYDLDQFRNILLRKNGLILVTGPVASGKSTTLYAMLHELNDGTRKIHTIEDPIEHPLSGIMQSQINHRLNIGFSELLSAVLRHSPDVVMIGEIRDRQTAQTAIRAGASGQLVLATVHSKSAAEAVDMVLHYESNAKYLAAAMNCVINQRLIKRLCPKCKQHVKFDLPQEVSDRVRERLYGQPATVYRAQSCEQCHEEGYDGLVCLPEVMVIGGAIEQAIVRGAAAHEIESIAAEAGMLRLGEVAQSYALRGVTTTEEVNRVVDDADLSRLHQWVSAAHETID